ncbi:MAG TPA: hypothetical protein VFF40_13165 [Acidimicrobiia bacterium]|nr:hypothetical protein [Acidimicrobiia bacterium]
MTSPRDPETVTGVRLEMLSSLGFGELQHDSHVPFLSHLLGTRRVLVGWGAGHELCDAGLFHSVYGTEYFPTATEVGRSQVREVIGVRAEKLAWLWCTIKRDTIDPTNRTAVDRHTGTVITFEPGELGDIATLWAADTVEQLHRMSPAERQFAHGLAAVLHLASLPARQAVEEALLASTEIPTGHDDDPLSPGITRSDIL